MLIMSTDPQDPHADLYDGMHLFLRSPLTNIVTTVDDETTIITLADWYHRFAPDLQAEYLSPNNTSGRDQVPDAGTINGGRSYLFLLAGSTLMSPCFSS
jgi:hypothetical protein